MKKISLDDFAASPIWLVHYPIKPYLRSIFIVITCSVDQNKKLLNPSVKVWQTS